MLYTTEDKSGTSASIDVELQYKPATQRRVQLGPRTMQANNTQSLRRKAWTPKKKEKSVGAWPIIIIDYIQALGYRYDGIILIIPVPGYLIQQRHTGRDLDCCES